MSDAVLGLSEDDLTRSLAYAGFVLLAYELVKSLIIDPIKLFYRDTTFSGGPFKSYELDVLSRHKNEFEACLLYLRHFMEAISSDDVLAIQGLRKHRNELAHDLPNKLRKLDVDSYAPLLEEANKALFKLSNYRTYMEIGHDPEFQDKGINWDTVYGTEYMIFKEVVEKVRILQKATK
jgi:hypothetical protein